MSLDHHSRADRANKRGGGGRRHPSCTISPVAGIWLCHWICVGARIWGFPAMACLSRVLPVYPTHHYAYENLSRSQRLVLQLSRRRATYTLFFSLLSLISSRTAP